MQEDTEKTILKKEINFYENLISPITVSHLERCSCCDALLKEIESKEVNEEIVSIRKEKLENNEVVVNHRIKKAQERAKEKLVWQLYKTNTRCSIEKELLKKDIEIFASRYDLNDPRAYMIVENILSLKLSVHRLSLHTSLNDSVQSVIDREGNLTYKLNPAEKAKMDYNNSIIMGIKELNLIFEGSKNININLNRDDLINMDELFSNREKFEGLKLVKEIK